MRILIPVNIDNRIDSNPFVRFLSEGLASYGHEVNCSIDELWNHSIDYDLIFFQWPDVLLIDNQYETQCIEGLEKTLDTIRNNGVKTMITVHNLHPHNNNQHICKLYDLIYDNIDVFHHMGNFSYELFKSKYPKAIHFVVPHSVNVQESLPVLKKECYKKKYGLPLDKPTVIAFGSFRNNEERKMFLDLSHKYFFKCCFWAPQFNRFLDVERGPIQKLTTRILYRLQGVRMFRGAISDSQAIEMVMASDILFIQRKDILNSGNLPLGFYGGCIVIGPDKGNVGDILQSTSNPVFDPNDKVSIHKALDRALVMISKQEHLGLKNAEYARKNWNRQIVMQKINDNINKYVKTAS